jgi:NAD(P) transhydrogenase subunit beta
MTTELMTQLGYVVASGLFIFGLKMLGSPATARRGNMVSAIGMLVAIVSALLDQGIVDSPGSPPVWWWVAPSAPSPLERWP